MTSYISKYGLKKIQVQVKKQSKNNIWFEHNGVTYKYEKEKFQRDFKKQEAS